jgi:hypothetical protein
MAPDTVSNRQLDRQTGKLRLAYVHNRPISVNLFVVQAELKTLQDVASPSFVFAQDLVKHNLVSWKN